MEGRRIVAEGYEEAGKSVVIPIPNPKLWGPETPFLYDLSVSIPGDIVMSYFGMRSVTLVCIIILFLFQLLFFSDDFNIVV